jgi:hypothetical protein
MINKYVRNAVPIYPGISEQSEGLNALMSNIGTGEYSVYKGTLVFWDVDHDVRVLTFIDNNEMLIPRILAVSESKAFLNILWLGKIPNFPKEVKGVNEKLPDLVEVAGDDWRVQSCKTSSRIWLPILKVYMLKAL